MDKSTTTTGTTADSASMVKQCSRPLQRHDGNGRYDLRPLATALEHQKLKLKHATIARRKRAASSRVETETTTSKRRRVDSDETPKTTAVCTAVVLTTSSPADDTATTTTQAAVPTESGDDDGGQLQPQQIRSTDTEAPLSSATGVQVVSTLPAAASHQSPSLIHGGVDTPLITSTRTAVPNEIVDDGQQTQLQQSTVTTGTKTTPLELLLYTYPDFARLPTTSSHHL